MDVNKLCVDDGCKKGSFVNEEYGKELRMELPSPQNKVFSAPVPLNSCMSTLTDKAAII